MANNTVILSRPVKSGCNFNAAGQPVVYKLRREDYQFAQINDDGGFAQIQINGSDLTTYFVAADTVYIEGHGLAGVTTSAFSGGNTLVTTDLVFGATATGYINNLSKRTDYKLEVEIFNADTDESLGPRIVSDFDQAGEVKVNIAGIVKTFLSADWDNVTTNEAEENTSIKAYIKYQEFYDVTYWELIDDSANEVVCVFAVVPLVLGSPPDFSRYAHGGNLLSYFPEDSTRLWLTRFNSPTYWRGWPFTLSFIWPTDIADISRRVVQYDSEGNELSDTITALAYDGDRIHRMTLGTIHADAVRLVVTLQDGAASGDSPIIDELTIEVKDPCDSQVLVFWKNTLGGDSFWMFDESQDYEWSLPGGRRVKRMTLYSDNLKIKDWDAINELNSNSEVINSNIVDYEMSDVINKTQFRNDNQVYIINQDAEKVGVIVIPVNNKTRTLQKRHSIEITIELPEFFTV